LLGVTALICMVLRETTIDQRNYKSRFGDFHKLISGSGCDLVITTSKEAIEVF